MAVKAAVEARLRQCKLEAHPDKTRIVYCRDSNRREDHEHIQFDFLGYTFRPRHARNREGELFCGFLPAISAKATKAMVAEVRDWRHPSQERQGTGGPVPDVQSDHPWLGQLLRAVLPDGPAACFCLPQSEARPLGTIQIQAITRVPAKSGTMAAPLAAQSPAVCSLGNRNRAVRRRDDWSRMSREAHVRFWESGRVKIPPATHLFGPTTVHCG